MQYEEFLISLSDIAPDEAYLILLKNPDHEYKKAYELIISKNADYSYYYARHLIQGRFELGENAISKDAFYSYHYAQYVIRGRFELGEEVIKKSIYKKDYAKYVMNDPNFWENR